MTTGTRHELTILGWTPSLLNKLTGSPYKAGRLKKQDRNVIGFAQHCVRLPAATGKRRVSLQVLWSNPGRLPDEDAFWKSTNDALVHAKLLVDDRPAFCKCGDVEVLRSDTPATKIILEEIPA